ncbi:Rossmann fold domain-containing protein [Novosphingobium sp.]|uniref:Rossmann fold domain-containing protein n=1 Tax=Novosphingobium sp. TaxID=1874826 RepID=UPI0035B002A3
MRIVRIEGLPDDPLAASARFHAQDLPALPAPSEDLLLVFPEADHTHKAWRLAAVQSLARAAVSHRVNAVSGGGEAAVSAAAAYLAAAPGVTGHLLVLDDAGAGAVLPSSE